MQKMLKYPIDPLAHHRSLDVRIYEKEQPDRIDKSRNYLRKTIDACGLSRPKIIELGCGALDISGFFAGEADVTGIECNQKYQEVNRVRNPKCLFICDDINNVEPMGCDILVACESLEHLSDPITIMERWMPLAQYALISHPIDEALNYPYDSEHTWSFTHDDFIMWFYRSSYIALEAVTFRNWDFNIIIGYGKKNADTRS